MTRRFLSLLAMLCVAMLVAGDAAYAAVTVTTSQNIAPDGGAAHDPYDPATDTPGSGPMMSASSTDIAQGLTATYMGGSDTFARTWYMSPPSPAAAAARV